MPQIIPIKDLKNTSAVSELCHQSDEPIYITKNGYGDMVIMSMENYEQLRSRMAMYESLERSELDMKEGRVMNAKSALSSMRRRYEL